MPIVSSYITLFLSLFMIFLTFLNKNNFITLKNKLEIAGIFFLMTTYSAIGLFWVLVSDSTWVYDYAETIYLLYNLFIFRKIYCVLKKGRFE